MATPGTPSAKAFRFVIDGQSKQYDAYLDLLAGAGSDKYIDCRYRPVGDTSGKWTWLTGPSIYPSQLDTGANADAVFDKSISIINEKIKEVFDSAATEVPLVGFARIEWLIQVGLKEVGNVISRV